MEFVPDIDRLTQIFSNAIAPAFFLGAVAAFVSLMMSRLAIVNERVKAARALPDQDRRCGWKQHGTWSAYAPRALAE